nr:DASS family sodium-coupled anion symporter [Boudabousia tangfeifanii]
MPISGLDGPQSRMLGIFLAAICLWVTEAIPLTATAVGVIFLEVVLISDAAIVPVGADATSAKVYFASLANPVLILFLGGFMIADGAAKYGLDKNLAALLLRPFGGSARLTLLGLMSITALLSAFMSNTATTAAMFAVVSPILKALPTRRARAGVALAIPVAANLGGIATPVGSPPNAIAIGALAEKQIYLTFAGWIALSLPIVLVLLLFSWGVLSTVALPVGTQLELEMKVDFDRSRAAIWFYLITALTIALWLTESLHGVASTIVGFFPVVAFLATQVMDGEDLKKISWPVLWLVAGGIALGVGVGATELDKWLLGSINWQSFSVLWLLLLLALVAVGMSNVISNSASANLLVPLTLGLGASISVDQGTVAVVIAIACSLAMCLPISTPPNAIAYATGTITNRAMLLMGLVVGILGIILLAFVMPFYWYGVGLLPVN